MVRRFRAVVSGARLRARLHPALLLGLALSGACSDLTQPDAADTVAADLPNDVPAAVVGVQPAPADEAIPGQYIVLFKDDVRDPAALATLLTGQHGGTIRHAYTAAVKGFAARLPDAAVDALRRNAHVASIEQDRQARQMDVQSPVPSWGVDRIDQRGWPPSATYAYANDGSGVHVYIIDSGIRATHVDFGGRASGAFTSIGDGLGTGDCTGHGTHVAGIVGSATYGVAKNVRLHAVRVLDCNGSGALSGIVAGVDWVTKNRTLPAVANMSLASTSSSTLNQAVQASIASGVVYVVAAANYSTDACKYSPASVGAALTVGATVWGDAQAAVSNFGPCVDLFAPGSAIRSTYNTSDTATASMGGTSMASPHVAGAAALYLAAHPTATPAEVTAAIVDNATRDVLTSLGANTANRLLYTGFITDGATTPPPSEPAPPPPTASDAPPTASLTASCSRAVCSFDASASTDDHGIVTYAWSFGDGSPVQQTAGPRASYTYRGTGSFTVTLTVTDAPGQPAQASRTVRVRKL